MSHRQLLARNLHLLLLQAALCCRIFSLPHLRTPSLGGVLYRQHRALHHSLATHNRALLHNFRECSNHWVVGPHLGYRPVWEASARMFALGPQIHQGCANSPRSKLSDTQTHCPMTEKIVTILAPPSGYPCPIMIAAMPCTSQPLCMNSATTR